MRAIADPHLALVRDEVQQTAEGYAECLRLSSPPAHLRLCLTFGHLGYRDSSPLRPARPIVRSFEPGKSRRWCHADEPYI